MTSKRDVKKVAKKDVKRVRQKVLKAAKEGVGQVGDKGKEPLHLEDKEVTYTSEELEEAFKGRSTCVKLFPVEMIEEARREGWELVPAVKHVKRKVQKKVKKAAEGERIFFPHLKFLIGEYIIVQTPWSSDVGKLKSYCNINQKITLENVYSLYNIGNIFVRGMIYGESKIEDVSFGSINREWKLQASKEQWRKKSECEDVIINLSIISGVNVIILKDEDMFKEFVQTIPPLIIGPGEWESAKEKAARESFEKIKANIGKYVIVNSTPDNPSPIFPCMIGKLVEVKEFKENKEGLSVFVFLEEAYELHNADNIGYALGEFAGDISICSYLESNVSNWRLNRSCSQPYPVFNINKIILLNPASWDKLIEEVKPYCREEAFLNSVERKQLYKSIGYDVEGIHSIAPQKSCLFKNLFKRIMSFFRP